MIVCRKGWIIVTAFLLQECFSKNCDQTRQWPSYLSGVYCLLSSFYFQENTTKFNVQNLNNWGQGGEQGIDIKDSNYKDFLKIMETYNVCLNQTDELNHQGQLQDLNSLLKVTLAERIYNVCKNGTFILTGTFVKITDLPKHPKCGNVTAKNVEVFALDTVYFDRAINTLQDVHLSILGPRWAPGKLRYKLSSPKNGSFLGIKKFMDQKAVDIDEYPFSTKAENKLTIYRIKSSPQFANTTLRYKNALRERLGERVLRGRILKFLTEIEADSSIRKTYRFPELVTDIMNLEDHYYTLSNNTEVDFSPFYNILLEDILQRMNDSNNDTRMFNFLYLTLVSRKGAIEDNRYMNLVVDMTRFCDTVVDDVKEFEKGYDNSKSRISKLNETKEENKRKEKVFKAISEKGNDTVHNFADKINTSVILIKRLNEDTVKNMNTSTNNSLDLINEIYQLQENAKGEIANLKDKQKKLQEALKTRTAGRAMDIFGNFLGIASSALSVAATLTGIPGLAIGSTVLSVLSSISGQVGNNIGRGAEDPTIPSNASGNYIVTQPNARDLEELNSINVKFDQNPCHEVLEANKTRNKRSPEFGDVFSSSLGIVTGLTGIFSALKDQANDEKMTDQKVEILRKQIEEIDEDIRKMKKMICDICNTVFPILKQITQEMTYLGNKLQNKTQAELIFTKWNMTQPMQLVRGFLNKYYDRFKSLNQIKNMLDDVNQATDTMISIFSLIDSYKDSIVDVQFETSVATIGNEIEPIEDEEFIRSFNELNSYFYSNAVFLEYKSLVNAVKQYSFPFAHTYITELHLPKEFNVKEDIKTMIHRIENIQTEINSANSKLLNSDAEKRSNKIFSAQKSDPFYIWKDPKAVYDILRGKEVKLKADIRDGKMDFNAVKFNIIGLIFRSEPDIQKQLEMALNDIRIKMHHLGDSYYNCNGKLYVISTPSSVFRFNFKEEQADVEDIDGSGNEVYKKYGKGDYVLSPYATWLIQIEEPISLDDLNRLKDSVNDITIELIGRGQYYDKALSCPDHLDEYYYELNSKNVFPVQDNFSQGKRCVAATKPIIVLNQDKNREPINEINVHL